MQHCGVFSTTWKPLPVSHVFTVMSWIVAQPLLSVKVFYNWLCLVRKPANNTSPFCSSHRYGKIVSTKAILDKATNKCKGVSCSFFFLSYQHCPLLSLLRFNMHERKLPRKIYSTYTFLKFSKNCSMQGVTSVIKKKSSRHVVSDHFRKQTVRLFKAASQLVLF